MDEYNLANAMVNHNGLQEHIVDLDEFQRIPFAELAGFGGAIAELIPQFRTVTETKLIPMEGIFRPINPKTGKAMSELMFRSKQVANSYVGSIRQADGRFDQAAFLKVPGVKEVGTTVAAINPATLMLAAGIVAMSKKLDVIEENQKRILGFLEKDKGSKLIGNLRFLQNVFDSYKSNWDNATFRQSQHMKTQDIKQESEHDISFYRSQLSDRLRKKKAFVSRLDVKKAVQEFVKDLGNYKIAIYLYAFASYLEIILLENFKADFLELVSAKIQEEAFKYAELYTIAYTKLENMAATSLGAGAIKGAAMASQGLGKVIERIPIVERGRIDENLIAAGKKLEEYRAESVDNLLTSLRSINNCQVKQFVDLIETVKELHHGEPTVLIDNESVYIQLAQ